MRTGLFRFLVGIEEVREEKTGSISVYDPHKKKTGRY